jgi:two-component system CheB/CheR fusion protein
MSNLKENTDLSTTSESSAEQESPAAERKERTKPAAKAAYPIVGMGASAGGLEALEQFFTAIPPDSGMAFVVVVHLSPDHKSMLSNILQKCTAMPVVEIEDGLPVEPNSVYVIAPDADVSLLNGTLHLLKPNMPRGRRAPIDYFFRSLSDDQAERAIALSYPARGAMALWG